MEQVFLGNSGERIAGPIVDKASQFWAALDFVTRYELACPAAFVAFLSARQFSKPCTTTKKAGTNSTARQVEASMPENTVMPIDLRALAPAPVASTSGKTPRMKAN